MIDAMHWFINKVGWTSTDVLKYLTLTVTSREMKSKKESLSRQVGCDGALSKMAP